MDGLLQLLSCIQQGWNLWLVKIIFVFPDTVDCFPNFCFAEKLWMFKASCQKTDILQEPTELLASKLTFTVVSIVLLNSFDDNKSVGFWKSSVLRLMFFSKTKFVEKFHCVRAPSFSMPSKPHIQVIFAWQIQSHFEMTIESLYWKVCPSVFQVSRWKLQGGNYKVAF